MDAIQETPSTISGLIDMWPSIAEFAADLDVGYEAAKQMRRRNSVAVEHWPRLMEACRQRGISGINAEHMVAMHTVSPRPEEAA